MFGMMDRNLRLFRLLHCLWCIHWHLERSTQNKERHDCWLPSLGLGFYGSFRNSFFFLFFFLKWWDVFFPSVFEALTPTIWGTFHLGWFSGRDCFICSYVYKYIIYLKFYGGTSWALKVFNLPSQTSAFCSPQRLILICLRAEALRAPPQKHFLHFLGRSFFFFFFWPWALSKVSPCKLCEKRYWLEQEPLRITSTPSAQPSPRPSLWGWG